MEPEYSNICRYEYKSSNWNIKLNVSNETLRVWENIIKAWLQGRIQIVYGNVPTVISEIDAIALKLSDRFDGLLRMLNIEWCNAL